jgi:crotonobetainyl-CoA:carnitine CoA-transferase CaiB-like acyl-CoA transferase
MPQPCPLDGIHVLEVGTGFALAYAGKLLADFGATVIKAEPAGGDALRRAPPLVETGQGAESALFAWLSAGKRSVAETPARLAALLPGCHALLDGRTPAARAAAPLGADDPGLIACALSWFGETGPYAPFAGTDAVARALAGVFFSSGPEAGPPQILDGFPGETMAGLAAGIAVAAALLSRAAGGRRLECSVLEANLAVAEYDITQAAMTPGSVRRHGRDRFFPTWPMGVYPCADGTWLGVTVVTPAQWRGFCAMLDLPALGADPDLVVGPNRRARAAELEAAFAPRRRLVRGRPRAPPADRRRARHGGAAADGPAPRTRCLRAGDHRHGAVRGPGAAAPPAAEPARRRRRRPLRRGG